MKKNEESMDELFDCMLNRDEEKITDIKGRKGKLIRKFGALLSMNGIYWAHEPIAIRQWNGKRVIDISKEINVRNKDYLQDLWSEMKGDLLTEVDFNEKDIRKLKEEKGNTEFIVPDIGVYFNVSKEAIEEFEKGQFGENLKKLIQNPDVIIEVWGLFWLPPQYYDYVLKNVAYKMLVYKELGLWDEYVEYNGKRIPRVIFVVPKGRTTATYIEDMVEELKRDEHFFFVEDLARC